VILLIIFQRGQKLAKLGQKMHLWKEKYFATETFLLFQKCNGQEYEFSKSPSFKRAQKTMKKPLYRTQIRSSDR